MIVSERAGRLSPNCPFQFTFSRERVEALGLRGSCLYQPTEKELTEHAAQWELFEAGVDLKQGLMNILFTDGDGWVHAENWEAMKEASDELLKKWLATEGDMDLETARQLWPCDY